MLEYEQTQETKFHSDNDFPFTIYPCSMPLDFTAVPTHWHNDMEIIYVKKGRGLVWVDLQPYLVRDGDFIIVCPGQLHRIEQYQHDVWEYENIIFQLSMLMSSQEDRCTKLFFHPLIKHTIPFPAYYPKTKEHTKELIVCLDRLDSISGQRNDFSILALKSCLFDFFYGLYLFFWEPAISRGQNKYVDQLKPILKYIEMHYPEKITIDDMAKFCGFSCSHFMRFFKNSMGCSFIDYLNDYRMAMAARLLAVSGECVFAVAQEVGYSNLSYFNRLFKRKFQLTPTQFRGG
jgi:AraC-like DNA-binding protein